MQIKLHKKIKMRSN